MNLWRWQEGESRIQRALQYSPQSAHVEHLYSMILLLQARYEEALDRINRALAIEHSSLFLRSHRVQVLLFARCFEECIRESEDLLEENSEFAMGLMNYGAALMGSGRPRDAALALERAYSMSPIPIVLSALAEAYNLSGEASQCDEAVERLRRVYRETGVSPVVMALGSLAAERTDEAVEWVEKAFEQHDVRLPLLSQTTAFDRIRGHEKVKTILASIYRGGSKKRPAA
jgi:tetratricopeptide (TPR) repeat protein